MLKHLDLSLVQRALKLKPGSNKLGDDIAVDVTPHHFAYTLFLKRLKERGDRRPCAFKIPPAQTGHRFRDDGMVVQKTGNVAAVLAVVRRGFSLQRGK